MRHTQGKHILFNVNRGIKQESERIRRRVMHWVVRSVGLKMPLEIPQDIKFEKIETQWQWHRAMIEAVQENRLDWIRGLCTNPRFHRQGWVSLNRWVEAIQSDPTLGKDYVFDKHVSMEIWSYLWSHEELSRWGIEPLRANEALWDSSVWDPEFEGHWIWLLDQNFSWGKVTANQLWRKMALQYGSIRLLKAVIINNSSLKAQNHYEVDGWIVTVLKNDQISINLKEEFLNWIWLEEDSEIFNIRLDPYAMKKVNHLYLDTVSPAVGTLLYTLISCGAGECFLKWICNSIEFQQKYQVKERTEWFREVLRVALDRAFYDHNWSAINTITSSQCIQNFGVIEIEDKNIESWVEDCVESESFHQFSLRILLDLAERPEYIGLTEKIQNRVRIGDQNKEDVETYSFELLLPYLKIKEEQKLFKTTLNTNLQNQSSTIRRV